MKIHKIISKSKNGLKMEVILKDDDGYCLTKHAHKKNNKWQYLIKMFQGQPTYGGVKND